MRIDDEKDPTARTIPAVLARQADEQPDQPFVIADGVRWTFADVDRMADRAAAHLWSLGVRAGDTVALVVESRPELVPLTAAVNRLGAVWVPTNTDYRGEWLRSTLEASNARVVIVDDERRARVEASVAELAIEHLIELGDAGSTLFTTTGPFDAPELHTGDTAAVLWTSGTTGRAKGVMQPHNAWIRAALTGAASSGMQDGDVVYCCLPLYNSAAWIACIYRALVSGTTVAIDPRFSVTTFWDRVRHFGATQSFTLGSMHIFLWQQEAGPSDADNPLRCLGATPMPDAILDAFKERFGVSVIQQGYGQSEIMGLISRIDDGSTAWNPNAAGLPLPGVDVRLLDDEDREVGVDEVGEFCVRPTEPYVLFNGYYRDPDATLDAFRNLWYHTGDLGRRDADGQFHFVDRKKDYIRFKGRSVSSFAVEAAVRAHPAVSEVAAFGVATAALASESELMVAVVLEAGAATTPAEIARFVNDNSPHFFVPRYIDIVDEIPHTPTGKVQKFALREQGLTDTTWDRDATDFELVR